MTHVRPKYELCHLANASVLSGKFRGLHAASLYTNTEYLGDDVRRFNLKPSVLIIALVGIAPCAYAVDSESAAQAEWRAAMAQTDTPAEGCFEASYPDIVWERVACEAVQARVHPVHASTTDAGGEITGNGHDYVASATGLITQASGGFSDTGVKSEKSVGVAAFGGGGILGANEYSLQINTNFNETTSACAGHGGCVVWQQFIYATDYNIKGKGAVFIQYWLIGWGATDCPSGWGSDGAGDCVKNSAIHNIPDVKIAGLGNLALEGTAKAGGNDTVMLTNGSKAYTVTTKDSVLDISSVWKQAEFNIVGDAGGSRANFNKGSSVTVTLIVLDGSTSAPKCVANDGTTGETNNLNLGPCTASGGIPNIQFTESN
jgi:hypothetical protein